MQAVPQGASPTGSSNLYAAAADVLPRLGRRPIASCRLAHITATCTCGVTCAFFSLGSGVMKLLQRSAAWRTVQHCFVDARPSC